MTTTIKLRRSSTPGSVPTVGQLSFGEVAVNTYDGKLYIKKDVSGTESIVEFSANPQDLLNLIKQVDGAGSGLDADLLDGANGAFYLDYDNFVNTPSDLEILGQILNVDGAGSLLDADLLDGQEGTYYLDYDNFTNVPPASLDLTLTGKVTGTAFTNTGIMTLATELANTGVTPGSYGSSSEVPILTIDEDGRITLASTSNVAGLANTEWYSANNTFQILSQDSTQFDTRIDDFDILVNMVNLDVGQISSPTANLYISASMYVNGNIELLGTVDGRDVAVDGAKLDRLEEDIDITLDGKVTGQATTNTGVMTITTELANTGVTAGIYGTAAEIPILTIDEDGRITSATTSSVAGVDDVIWYSANNTFSIETGDGTIFDTPIDSFGANVAFSDNATLSFGTDNDLEIYHDGTYDWIKGTGVELRIASDSIRFYKGNTIENMLQLNADSDVKIYYNNSEKMATTATGISVFDDITVAGLVDGRDIATDGLKLDGIEPGATTDQTAADIRALGFFDVTNDGDGSLLDADLLDGFHAQDILDEAANTAASAIGGATIFLVAGAAIDGGGDFDVNAFANTTITFDHEDTSSVSNTTIVITNPGGTDTVISSIDFDEFGHVVDIQTANAQFGISEAEADLLYVNVVGDTMTGDLEVPNITITGNLNLEHGKITSVEVTTNLAVQTTLDSFTVGTYKSVEYLITAKAGTSIDVTKILAVDGGAGNYVSTEFARVTTNNELGTYEVFSFGGTSSLLVTPASGLATVFTIIGTYTDS
jgi:hypothetical protein